MKQLLSIGDRQSPFQGVAGLISPENLPPFIFQKLINYEIAHEIGTLKKRGLYGNLITGESGLANMEEWIDKNGGRQLFIKKGSTIRESVYAAGVYGALAAFANDERTAGSTVNEIYPVVFEKVIRTGAGLNAATDKAMWAGYIDACSRFPNDDAVSIAAGKYLCEQFLDNNLDNVLEMSGFPSVFEIEKTGEDGPGANVYKLYFSPVIDGYQRGLVKPQMYGITLVCKELADGESLRLLLKVDTLDEENEPRITAIDVFVASTEFWPTSGDDYLDAYFIQRIPLDDDGPGIMNIEGTFEDTNPPTYIDFDNNTDWETFNMTGMMISMTSPGSFTYRLVTRTTPSGAISRFTLASAVDASLQNQTVQCTIFPRWYESSGDHYYPFIYDNYYFKKQSSIEDYIGIGVGDAGRGSDLRYKYGCEANRRYFIFGTNDGFGYFSKANNPDVMPALNILRMRQDIVGCVGLGRDVLAFGKIKTSRITVFGEANSHQDDDFLDYGCSNHESIVKLSDKEAAWMSYKGPILADPYPTPIGEALYPWWQDTLGESAFEACVGIYNYEKDQIWFSFPTYTSTDFPSGVIFVFDRKAKRNGLLPWFYFKTDHAIIMKTIAETGNLLTGGATKIANWNSAVSTETCDTLVKLLILKNPKFGKRAQMSYKKVYVDYSSSDTPTARIYVDSGAAINLTLDTDYEAFIHYLAETLELEIITSASANNVDINKIQLEFKPKSL